jgi:hypothetical protein
MVQACWLIASCAVRTIMENRSRQSTFLSGYFMMPKGVRHFVWAKGPTTIQVHGMGPLDINYVNPADYPRQKK